MEIVIDFVYYFVNILTSGLQSYENFCFGQSPILTYRYHFPSANKFREKRMNRVTYQIKALVVKIKNKMSII